MLLDNIYSVVKNGKMYREHEFGEKSVIKPLDVKMFSLEDNVYAIGTFENIDTDDEFIMFSSEQLLDLIEEVETFSYISDVWFAYDLQNNRYYAMGFDSTMVGHEE